MVRETREVVNLKSLKMVEDHMLLFLLRTIIFAESIHRYTPINQLIFSFDETGFIESNTLIPISFPI